MTCQTLNIYNPLQTSKEIEVAFARYEIKFALNRMLKNIELINTGVNTKTIYASNTTLYAIAAEEYQDARLWMYLAAVNKLSDPKITVGIELSIPPKPVSNFKLGE